MLAYYKGVVSSIKTLWSSMNLPSFIWFRFFMVLKKTTHRKKGRASNNLLTQAKRQSVTEMAFHQVSDRLI